jgi:hypothetical protein
VSAITAGGPAPFLPAVVDPLDRRALDALDAWAWDPANAGDAYARRERSADLLGGDAVDPLTPIERRDLEALRIALSTAGSLDDLAAARRARERAEYDLAAAAAGSLDTGQQLDIGDSRHVAPTRAKGQTIPLGQPDPAVLARTDRLQRNDRAKAGLVDAIRAAAGDVYDGDPGGAAILDRMAGAVGGCRSVRAYRDTCGAWLARPESCHVRVCPDCERSRSGRLVRRLSDVAADMDRPAMWTYTLPNVPAGSLGLGLDVVLESFAKLRRLAIFAGGPCKGAHDRRGPACCDAHAAAADGAVVACNHPPHRDELAAVGSCRCARHVLVGRRRHRGCPTCVHRKVAGGVYSLEVTYNAARGDWHPHIHALVDAPYVLHSEMTAAWRGVTCDATRRAELRGTESRRATGKRREDGPRGRVKLPRCAHRADAKGRPLDGCRGASIVWVSAVPTDPGKREAALRETVKYVTKGLIGKDGAVDPAIAGATLAELLLGLRGRRLVAGWGSLRHVTDDEDEERDVLAGPDVPAELRGLPRVCPFCKVVADWSFPITVPRAACRPLADGSLVWRPPRGSD